MKPLPAAEAFLYLDCGGKRSATPLWISERSQAPSPLRSAGALQIRNPNAFPA